MSSDLPELPDMGGLLSQMQEMQEQLIHQYPDAFCITALAPRQSSLAKAIDAALYPAPSAARTGADSELTAPPGKIRAAARARRVSC